MLHAETTTTITRDVARTLATLPERIAAKRDVESEPLSIAEGGVRLRHGLGKGYSLEGPAGAVSSLVEAAEAKKKRHEMRAQLKAFAL